MSGDTFITETLAGTVFDGGYLYDSSDAAIPIVVSGTFVSEFDPNGTLVGVSDVLLNASSPAGGTYPSTLTFSSLSILNASAISAEAELNVSSENGGNFYSAILDLNFGGEYSASLLGSDGSQSTQIGDGNHGPEQLTGNSGNNQAGTDGTSFGEITNSQQPNNDIFITETLSNAVFDGTQVYNNSAAIIPVTVSGTYVTEYTPDGVLNGVSNISLIATTSDSGYNYSSLTSGSVTSVAVPDATSGTPNEIEATTGGGSFQQVYLDFYGQQPTELQATSGVGNPSGKELLGSGGSSNAGTISGSTGFDVNTFIANTLTNAVFDGPFLYNNNTPDPITVSGTYITEFNTAGTLIGVTGLSLTASSTDPSTYPSDLTLTSFTAGTPGGSGGYEINELVVGAAGGNFYLGYLDSVGEEPVSLTAADGSHTSAIADGGNYLEALAGGALSDTGTISATVLDTFIETTITSLIFDNDGQAVTVSGSFEAEYNPGGTLVTVSNVALQASGAANGALGEYSLSINQAGTPGASGAAGLNEIAFYGNGDGTLYFDYYGEQPSADFTGSFPGNVYSSFNLPNTYDYEQIGATGSAGIVTNEQVAPCFAAGMRIATSSGEIAVQSLAVGDEVRLATGGTARIQWIGRRRVNLAGHPRPDAVQPVCIAAGALAQGIPARALVVSPDHAMFLDGLLVPAKALINGATITQLNRKSVTYYHIELAAHGVLLAEGAPTESYLETGNRGAFENGGPAVTLHPDFAQSDREAKGCAPFAESGPAVEAIRARILARAGAATTDDAGLEIRFENGNAIIYSRNAVPAEVTPDPRDRRTLGVKIATIRVAGAEIPLDHPALTQGWHDAEPDGRWTKGAAVIPAALLNGRVDVTVEIAATLPYRVAQAA